MKTKYVIDKCYSFDVIADGARPSCADELEIRVRLTHEDAMEMGEYFDEEDPCEIDCDYDFGLKDELDTSLAESLSKELEEEWEEEHSYDEEDEDEDDDEECEEEDEEEEEECPDFYEQAYELMSEMYYCWNDDLKEACIKYYLAHKDEEPE